MAILREIKRRKVIQAAAVYAVVAWLLIQIVATVEAPLNLPDWTDTLVIVLLFVGFPITLIISWAFNLTPQGLVPDKGAGTAASSGGRGFGYALVGLVVIATGWLIFRWQIDNPDGGEQEVVPNSIAVLPCDNFSTDPENDYFAASLHQELLNQLVKLHNLNVIARTSVLQYAAAARPITEIASELRVESVMECSVAYGDGRIVISAQLVDGSSGLQLWSNRYNRQFEDVFGIQADIATNVAKALSVEFSLEEQETIESAATDSPEAYALYLRALEYMAVDGAMAMDLLEQALGFDPNFARAHFLMAWLHSEYIVNTLGSNAVSADESKRHAELANMHAVRAADLDPAFEASWITTVPKIFYWHWNEALAELEKAPDPMEQGGVWLYSFVDEHEDAIARARRGLDLNPKDWSQLWTLAAALAYAGERNEAERVQKQAIAIAPAIPVLHSWLAHIEIALGNSDDAFGELERAQKLMAGNRQIVMLPELAYDYSRIGRDEDAKQLFDELEQADDDVDVGAGGWAMAYLAIGEQDDAAAQLEEAIDEIENTEPDPGFFNLMNIRMNVTADPLLEEPKFVALREQLRGE